ncbi:hydrogenase maturation protein [Actinoplanes sp. GCM10030250]|uniref:hydrogenase maturation protein n=1 Tax=Actinoplanes sp. GCM10030250 TaxID=3273376 RepID=UPI00361ABF64
MRVLLLVSAFNGLSQRVWCELRAAGHEVGVLLAAGQQETIDGVRAAAPELIICPFLKHRVPRAVSENYRTVIIHPGPVGDRGPSSLDWAIGEGATEWGVTALQAVDELDAGPIWATRTFPMPHPPVPKSALYNGPVADAALQCVMEVIVKGADPQFVPVEQHRYPVQIPGARPRPAIRQADRAFDWSQTSAEIARMIRAADGTPGVRTEIAGLTVHAFDAHPGQQFPATPGRLLARRMGAVQVATGDGSVWLGRLRRADAGSRLGIKLPATSVLPRQPRQQRRRMAPPLISAAPLARGHGLPDGLREITYRPAGAIGWLTINFYNGAMSTEQCRRLASAVRHAATQDTRALVLTSSTEMFSNGIDLNSIEAAADPAAEAWDNIQAINTVCRQIIECTSQPVITAFAGNAGAGGVMLGLGADVVAARAGIVLNPYYDIGLYGSELHTWTLPRRVGVEPAQRLLTDKLPVTAEQAASMGLVDAVGPRHPEAWMRWLAELAHRHSDPVTAQRMCEAKQARQNTQPMPVAVYELRELAEMSRDIFDDRSGFAAARRAFVFKAAPRIPDQLRMQPATMIGSRMG